MAAPEGAAPPPPSRRLNFEDEEGSDRRVDVYSMSTPRAETPSPPPHSRRSTVGRSLESMESATKVAKEINASAREALRGRSTRAEVDEFPRAGHSGPEPSGLSPERATEHRSLGDGSTRRGRTPSQDATASAMESTLQARAAKLPGYRPNESYGAPLTLAAAAKKALGEESISLRLEDILSPRTHLDNPGNRPRQSWATAVTNVELSSQRASQMHIQGDWLCAHQRGLGYSGPRGQCPRQVFPCFLKSNREGDWIGSRGRHASLEEHVRAQGILSADIRWPEPPYGYSLLGNAMRCNILQRIFHSLLPRLWGFSDSDPWGTGEAQAALRRDVLVSHAAQG